MDLFISPFWAAQVVGTMGLALMVVAFQSKTRKNILGLQMTGAFVFAIHFALLAAFIGSLVQLLIVVRNWVFSKRETSAWANHVAWLYLFIALLILFLSTAWQGWVSILPVLGTAVGSYGVWQKNPHIIRFMLLAGSLIWTPYFVLFHSYPGMVTQAFLITSLCAAIIRLDRRWLKERFYSTSAQNR